MFHAWAVVGCGWSLQWVELDHARGNPLGIGHSFCIVMSNVNLTNSCWSETQPHRWTYQDVVIVSVLAPTICPHSRATSLPLDNSAHESTSSIFRSQLVNCYKSSNEKFRLRGLHKLRRIGLSLLSAIHNSQIGLHSTSRFKIEKRETLFVFRLARRDAPGFYQMPIR